MSHPQQGKTSALRPLLAWLGVCLVAVATAALAAPLVVRVIDTVGWFEDLRRYSNTKVFRRLVVVFFLAAVWLWRRRLTLPRADQIGLTRHPGCVRHLSVGFLIAFFGLGLTQISAIVLGHRVVDSERGLTTAVFLWAALKGLSTGVVVGLVEEILFRGALFGYFLDRTDRKAAILLTSFLFAPVHFFRAESSPVPRYSLLIGPSAAWDLLCSWWEHFKIFPDMLGLILVSVVLCWSVLLAGDLYIAIGLHAGWVFVIQTARRLLDAPQDVSRLVFGGSQFYDGLVGLVMLLAMIPFLHLCVRLGWIRPVGGFPRRAGSPG